MEIDKGKITLNETYKVSFDDCCVKGQFTSKVTLIERDVEEPEYVERVEFSNGVTLTEFNAVRFEAGDEDIQVGWETLTSEQMLEQNARERNKPIYEADYKGALKAGDWVRVSGKIWQLSIDEITFADPITGIMKQG